MKVFGGFKLFIIMQRWWIIMPSKYASIKFAVLITPLFVLVPLTVLLVDVFNVSSKDLVFLFVSGLMLALEVGE